MAHILIAEHNQTIASYLAAKLRKAGNSVVLADNCLDAWKMSTKESFDVLLIDIIMPGVDSFVLAQKALQDTPDLQVVFITGFAGVAMDMHATPSYAPTPVTTRPFHLAEIVSRVRHLMGQGSPLLKAAPPAPAGGNVRYADFSRKNAAAQQ